MALVGLSQPGSARAQQPTAAVVVNGADDVGPIREPVFGALRARSYATVAPDSVDAAIALALSGQPITEANAPQLRGAVNASVLYLVSLQSADGDGVFFSLQRFDANGVQNAFGRATTETLIGQLIQQLLTLEQTQPTAATATATTATSDSGELTLAPPPEPTLAGTPSAAQDAPVQVAEWVVPPGSTGVATRAGIGPQAAPPPVAGAAEDSGDDVLWSASAVIAVVASNAFDNSHGQAIFQLTFGTKVDSDSGIGIGLFGAPPSFDDEHYPGWFVATGGFMISGVEFGVGGGALIPGSGDAVGAFAIGGGGTLILGANMGIALNYTMLIHSDPVVVDFIFGIGFGAGGPSP